MTRLVVTSMAILIVVFTHGQTGAFVNARSGQQSTTAQSAVAETPEAIRGLIKEGRYREAETAARALLPRVLRSGEPASLPAAEGLDLLVEPLCQTGRAAPADVRR